LPIASTDEQLALQASVREWAKRSAVIDVVRGLEPGAGALELTGTAGAAADGDGDGDGDGSEFSHEFLLTRCLSIAGGTTQILLSLVAERQLGLPREEVR
jgi:alkylation response protein AidB-like acyl-CoA dehydrogenase